MSCRPGCGACCIAPSISSAIPGMISGKPAGIACIQLDEAFLCKLFLHSDRPAICNRFRAQAEWCGDNREDALLRLSAWEKETL